MRKASFFFTALTAIVLSAAPLHAQLTPERIARDKGIAYGVRHSYDPGTIVETPAPKGYKPFYISHVGRHGSRYDLGDGGAYGRVSEALVRADSIGILTTEGQKLLGEVRTMMDTQKGMHEMLTQRGCREHRGIAERMMKRFPQVFSSKTRTEVDAVSSEVQRCILSMSNFLLALGSGNPELDITMDTGSKYMRYLMVWDGRHRSSMRSVRSESRAYLEANLDPSRLFGVLFSQPDSVHVDPYDFCRNLFVCSAYTECMDLEDKVDIAAFFTPEEFFVLAANDSDVFYAENGNSPLYGEKTAAQGRRLLQDIITKADVALEQGSRRAADLRFTHDTAILPLCTLMDFSGVDICVEQTRAHEQVCTGDVIMMGSNLQIIFYSSKRNPEILVKVLYNEKERTFKALDAVEGPYYRWSDLKEYFNARIQR